MVVVFLILVHFESLFGVSFVVKDHHFTVRILVGIPTFNMPFFIRYFVSLLGVFMISRSVSKLVTVWPMDTLLLSSREWFEKTE